MAQPSAKIRLFVGAPLGAKADVVPGREQAHHLFSVMRLRADTAAGAAPALWQAAPGDWR